MINMKMRIIVETGKSKAIRLYLFQRVERSSPHIPGCVDPRPPNGSASTIVIMDGKVQPRNSNNDTELMSILDKSSCDRVNMKS